MNEYNYKITMIEIVLILNNNDKNKYMNPIRIRIYYNYIIIRMANVISR
jgi:hypothetical protein